MFVLSHSSLVAPFTWGLVASEFGYRGYEVVVPHLHGGRETASPYWGRPACATVSGRPQ